MQYVIEDEYIIDLDVQLKQLPKVDMEIVLPLLSIEKKMPIYRGKMLGDGATPVWLGRTNR